MFCIIQGVKYFFSSFIIDLTIFVSCPKNLIQNMEEETVRNLAIRVQPRGIGSLKPAGGR